MNFLVKLKDLLAALEQTANVIESLGIDLGSLFDLLKPRLIRGEEEVSDEELLADIKNIASTPMEVVGQTDPTKLNPQVAFLVVQLILKFFNRKK